MSMFDWVHNNKRLMQVILGLMVLPFAFFGVESYQALNATTEVASVDGQKITEQEFSSALQQQQDRLRSMLGQNFDAAMLDSPEMRNELIEGMISQRLLTQEAVRSRLNISDERLREIIASIPAFQVDGKFSKDRYEATLKAEGQLTASFENSLRRDLMIQQLAAALSEAGIASKTAAKQLAAFRVQRREVAESTLTSAQFAGQVKPTPEAVQAYYEANKARFQVPEQVRLEYVVLNADALAAAEPVPESEIKQVYESNLAKYGDLEQRQASHILIAFKPGASDADKAKAREKALQLAEQAKKSPAGFADLARKNSEDPGSAPKGGELGYFGRGMMVGAFENAVFAMKVGEISAPVESDFGLHIIRLTSIKPAKLKSLSEVHAGIEAELRKQKAGRKFAESADLFSNLVYEQSDSLKPVAEKFKLTIQQSGWMIREAPSVPQLRSPKALAAIFSDDVIKSRRNSAAVEVGPGTLVSARVIEHKPAAQRPLDEVRADVVKQLIVKESTDLARKQGAEKLAALKKGEVVSLNFSTAKVATRDRPEGLRSESLGPVFRADVTKLPAYVGVETSDGYAIYRISKVIAVEVDEVNQKGIQTELARMLGTQEFRAYLAGLRADNKVQINKELLQKKAQ